MTFNVDLHNDINFKDKLTKMNNDISYWKKTRANANRQQKSCCEIFGTSYVDACLPSPDKKYIKNLTDMLN